MEEKYFAAVNSYRGFESYYQDMFGAAERSYIIKGGPGTGKSYFTASSSIGALRSLTAPHRTRLRLLCPALAMSLLTLANSGIQKICF